MLKALFASGALIACSTGAAYADGFYLNPEYNAGFSGNQFAGSSLEGHVGWEKGAFYIQGGPALANDGSDSEWGWSAKTGVGAPVTEKFDIYGEVSVAKFEARDAGYGLKVGGKYKF